jgi:putative ABC transport system permease protein
VSRPRVLSRVERPLLELTHGAHQDVALGAGLGAVAGLVLRRGAFLALVGVANGVVAALASVRLLGSVLYGVSRADPLAFASASLLMIRVALAAS